MSDLRKNESTESEYDVLLARHRVAMTEAARRELSAAADLTAAFARLAASVGVTLNDSAFSYAPSVGIFATAPGLARALLAPRKGDKEGLFQFTDLASAVTHNRFQSGYFRSQGYSLMCHPCFRRGMYPLNNWAPLFVELYWALDLPGVEKYIAIDEDRVRIDVDRPAYAEADTWYGAPFSGDIAQIPAGRVKLRPPLDIESVHVDIFFANTYCLDIKWADAPGIKAFQALELKTSDVLVERDGVRLYPARYLHAEFDLTAGTFRHFDGAIQWLTEDEYLQRRDSDLNFNTKGLVHIKARSKKVFKLSGPVPTETWVELCCHFLAGNPLTFEYFTGSYPAHVSAFLEHYRARSGA